MPIIDLDATTRVQHFRARSGLYDLPAVAFVLRPGQPDVRIPAVTGRTECE